MKLNGNNVFVNEVIASPDLGGLNFTPLPDLNGDSPFTFFISDGQDNSAETNTVTLQIQPVNDPPDFTIAAMISRDEDFSPSVILSPTVAPIPADEVSQVVVYSITPEVSDTVGVSVNTATGTITLSAIPNVWGKETFTLMADDGQSENHTASRVIVVTINSVNDPPTISPIDDVSVEANDPVPPILFTVDDIDNDPTTLTVSGNSSNATLLNNSDITISGTGTDRTATLAPLSGQAGLSHVTLTVSDGLLSASEPFDLTVSQVTGIDNGLTAQQVVVPNPAKDFVEITLPAAFITPAKVLVRDLAWRMVMEVEILSATTRVSLDGLAEGFYILTIEDHAGHVFRTKILTVR